jgi:hypothetical protein
MLAHTWEVMEFQLDALRATQYAHIEVRWVYEKKTLYVHKIKLLGNL